MGEKAVRFVGQTLALLIFLLSAFASSSAEEFRTPAISVVRVDWRAALDQLRAEIAAVPSAAVNVSFARRHNESRFDPRSMPALVQLNAITSPIFTGIGQSPVPVLLPFDAAGYIGARLNGAPADDPSLSRYQADFRPVDFFDAGQAGYDAVFSLPPDVARRRAGAHLCEARRSGDHRVALDL